MFGGARYPFVKVGAHYKKILQTHYTILSATGMYYMSKKSFPIN